MRVNCLGCGHLVNFWDDTYDNFEGQIRCYACGTILEIRTEEGQIKGVTFVQMVPRPEIEEAFEKKMS